MKEILFFLQLASYLLETESRKIKKSDDGKAADKEEEVDDFNIESKIDSR